VGGECARAALAGLRAAGRPAAVHGVRKQIKKLRALFRLVRGGLGRGVYRKNARSLRTAARCLAPARDARVRLRALEKLVGDDAAGRFPEIHAALQKNCRQETRRITSKNSVALAQRILKKADWRARNLKLKATGWAVIEPGMMQCCRRGRAGCQLVRAVPSSEQFHDWRKHVKDLWYYFCLLSPALPVAARTQTESLALLGELLGDEHDLFLLQQFLVKTGVGRVAEAPALHALIRSRQGKLRAAAVKLGSRLYAEMPADVCLRLKQHWEDWHEQVHHR
jgi:CHAD domain-containing protein